MRVLKFMIFVHINKYEKKLKNIKIYQVLSLQLARYQWSIHTEIFQLISFHVICFPLRSCLSAYTNKCVKVPNNIASDMRIASYYVSKNAKLCQLHHCINSGRYISFHIKSRNQHRGVLGPKCIIMFRKLSSDAHVNKYQIRSYQFILLLINILTIWYVFLCIS